jgi:membrane protein required for colicin V production
MLATFDIVVLVVLAIAAIRGAMKGIVWQLAVIGSIVLCFAFSESGSVFIAPMLPIDPPLNRWVAMLILYIVLSFAAFGVARLMHTWIEKMKFKEYDRHLGFLFGAVKGLIICLVGTFFVVTLSSRYREAIMNSYSGHAAAIIMDRLHPVMPDELHDVLEPYIHQLDQPGLDLQHVHDGADAHANNSADGHVNAGHHGDSDDQPDGESIIDRLLAKVGGETAESLAGLGALLKNAFQNTSPEDRNELLNNIRSASPGRLHDIADIWKNGKPDEELETPPFDNDFGAVEREFLIGEIVAKFQVGPTASAEITAVIEQELVGIPDRVASAVLADWHADLAKITPDPDPETDASLPLDARILRQLKQANVPLTSLSSNLQNRLRESRQ